MPTDHTVSLSALSTQALYYLGSDTLKHKVLFVAEEEGASRASYALKLLQSEGKLSIATAGKDARTGRITTTTSEVTGPVALVMTTTIVDLDEELSNRLVCLFVDETPEQTRAVLAAQRLALSPEALAASARRDTIVARHRNAQSLLEPLAVVVPDPSRLWFADATTRARRDHAKYLSLICASALLHQFQRPRRRHDVDGASVEYIEATGDDIALADRLASDVLVRDTSELPPGTESLLRQLSAWAGTEPFTRRRAREALALGDTQLKVHLRRMVDLEYVVVSRSDGGVCYTLCWSGSAPNTTPESEPTCKDPERSGVGRGEVGPWSGVGRATSAGIDPQVDGQKPGAGSRKRRERGGAGDREVHVDVEAAR